MDVEGLIERAMAGLTVEHIGPELTTEVEDDLFEGLL